MEKEYLVREAVKKIFSERRDYSASAGEVGRKAGVSVNTAKKYLKKMVAEEVGLYGIMVYMANGLVATVYAYDNRHFED